MAAGDLVVNLKLNGTEFAVEIKKANELLRRFGAGARGAGNQAGAASRQVTSLMGKLRDIAINAYAAVHAFNALKAVMVDWQMSIIETNARIEKMTFLLAGLSTETDLGARFRAASVDMKAMFDLAESAPFAMDEMAESFVKFKAVNLEDPLRTLKGLTDAIAAFGGSEDELHRASVAIMQMAGKGVISMEELRQQLGEAVPSAINIMARELGMSYFELVDTVSKGALEAQRGISALTRGFEKELGGSAAMMMTTWNGMLSKLKTKWVQFQLEIGGQDGFFKEAKNSISQLIDLLDTAEMKDFGRDFGAFLAESIVQLRDLLEWVVMNRSEIIAVTKSSIAFIAVWQGTKIMNSLISGFSKLWMIIKLGGPMFTYLAAFHPALRAISIAVTAVATGAAALYAYTNATKAAEEAEARLRRGQAEAAGEVDEYAEALERANKQLSAMDRMGDTLVKIKTDDLFAEWRIALDEFSESVGESGLGARFELAKVGFSNLFANLKADGISALGDISEAVDDLLDSFASFPTTFRILLVNYMADIDLLFATAQLKFSQLLEKIDEKNPFSGWFAKEPTADFAESTDPKYVYDKEAKVIEDRRRESIAQINDEMDARKKEQREKDEAALATTNLARQTEALTAAGNESIRSLEAQVRVIESYSDAFKRAKENSESFGESMIAMRDKMVPGQAESTALANSRAEYAAFLANATVMLDETKGWEGRLRKAEDDVAKVQSEWLDTLVQLSRDGDTAGLAQAIAVYENAIGQLGNAMKKAELDGYNYNATLEDIARMAEAVGIVFPKMQEDLVSAVGKQIDSNGLKVLSDLKDIHAALEKAYNLPAGIMDVIKEKESGKKMNLDIQGQLITDKSSMHYGDRAQGLYQVMPKTLREYPNADMSTIHGQATQAAEYLARAMAIHGAEVEKLFASYVAGAGYQKRGLNSYGKDYVSDAMAKYRRNLEDRASDGGEDGQDAVEELAQLDKLNQEKLARDAKFSREMVALHGKRGSDIAQLTIAYENQIAEVRESTLSEEQKTEKIKALYSNMYTELAEMERQARLVQTEYDRQTREIELGMLTADKDLRARLEEQLQIDIARVKEQGGATAEQIQRRIAAMTARVNQEIIDNENKKWLDLANNIGDAMGNALGSLINGGETAGETLRKLLKALQDMIIKLLIIEPLARAISNYLSGFIPTGKISPNAGANARLGSPPGQSLNFATGGVVGTSLPHGIYRSPTYFPLANAGLHKFANGTGLLAEAGRAEAILPLERIGGDLGVKASMSPVNIVVNNNAPGVSANAQQSENGSTIEIIIEQIKASVAGEISTGRGGIGTAMERTYGLNRVAGAF